MASYDRPSLKELIETSKSSVLYAMNGVDSTLPVMLASIFATAIASLAHLLHAHLDFIINQFFVHSCTDDFLYVHGSIYNVQRIPATYSFGNALAKGTVGAVVEKDKLLISGDNEYRVLEEVVLDALGEGTLSLKSETAGISANIGAGAILSFTESIAGVEKAATVDVDGISGGLEEETFDEWRARIIEVKQTIPSGGSESDYKVWVKESLPGITRVFVQGQKTAPNNVSISYIFDGREDIIPTTQEMAVTQSYINDKRPVTADPVVFALTKQPVDLQISLTPDTTEVRDAVTSELKDLFAREATPEGEMYLSHIREAISLASGEDDHDLVSPAANPVASAGSILTMGNITWA